MAHKEMTPFSVSLNPTEMTNEDWEKFNEMMNLIQNETVSYERKLCLELGVCSGCACSITYLRGRSRWNENLEQRLVNACKNDVHISTLSGEEDEMLQAEGF